ncbi:hypothetical protein GCM10023320_49810 [Pseudonocardia adelaidensis]|uniref:Uncharacterized protein n=1 Tax=Pseudonocardia adelaidensis TaxID=648754 RepID=A0ABP9NNZ4_9PSEU
MRPLLCEALSHTATGPPVPGSRSATAARLTMRSSTADNTGITTAPTVAGAITSAEPSSTTAAAAPPAPDSAAAMAADLVRARARGENDDATASASIPITATSQVGTARSTRSGAPSAPAAGACCGVGASTVGRSCVAATPGGVGRGAGFGRTGSGTTFIPARADQSILNTNIDRRPPGLVVAWNTT